MIREQRWKLCRHPHRHYKYHNDKGKWSWQIGRERIAGVTTILDGGQDQLTQWAANTALAASEQIAVDWFGAAPALAKSCLSFGQMAELSGRMPNDVRDRKGHTGNLIHGYLAARLCGLEFPGSSVPFGLRYAVDQFVREHDVAPVRDELGVRVERCVGDTRRAVGGTYDAQVWMLGGDHPGTASCHRIDAKQSNTIQPKHYAQLAAYERCATLCGEQSSDYLTLVHLMPTGDFDTHSIKVGGPDHALALAVFDAYLLIHRGVPALSKLLKIDHKEYLPA